MGGRKEGRKEERNVVFRPLTLSYPPLVLMALHFPPPPFPLLDVISPALNFAEKIRYV
jgi:hypothetical protein